MAKSKRKVIITAALTGAFQGKEENPNLPEQPEEIAQAAYECYNAGAAIVHLHARDRQGRSTNDPRIFSEINAGVRAKCPIITQNSTSPPTKEGATADDGLGPLSAEVRPEMCSLDCTLVYGNWKGITWLYEWTRPWLTRVAGRMKELGIKPELEVFSPTTIEEIVSYLYPAGVLDEPLSFSFVMGMDRVNQGAMQYSKDTILHMIGKLPKESLFSALAIGHHQLEGTVFTMLLGGNVRVGFEDNVYYRYGELAKSNAQLVERIARFAVEFGYDVATPKEAREILGLPPLR